MSCGSLVKSGSSSLLSGGPGRRHDFGTAILSGVVVRVDAWGWSVEDSQFSDHQLSIGAERNGEVFDHALPKRNGGIS